MDAKSPPPSDVLSLSIDSEEATVRLAQALAPHLGPSDIVLLDGALAAGKTFFVRALVDCLKTDDHVSSPTYTIANIYQTAICDVLHVDAYRLSDAQEFYNLGLDTQIDESICLIEWGSRIAPAFDEYLQISIAFADDADDARIFEISHVGRRWPDVIGALKTESAD
ncbi:tRNA (adenosine(37)-N6)-threonylcarbamoyltransferase complex ATPase subunit type 1 TsaE [Yoonia sediminilitoris]|uniref:tRNA threonylcarbamoyladenosine biosynthesis protein TsaE n=1 Tax=Yoonia sediminilitoris TaxID=1286148 RepID=A0A2T6KAF1_9RHOB|nr:tRNA (adenosine(37)-N6)-threonylcarbamoyltransferase complex ATPase subunit type 1 TsaE [Yoonia sediminilitoris]PUB11827.1 tRNA threonylcarbamoyladenosine biosynthesis protein TsaE [Yoonia sediminilitoris]RCW91904.1 tRNA threonylcarbamoyladenosine biosynthesis protein TsaE [Yoonia sediminilitoris]